MLSQFKEAIAKYHDPNSKIALAISGGIDSVCLAYLFNEAEISFQLVHCNFKLRGDESESEVVFISNLAAKLKYCEGLHQTSFNTKTYCQSKKISTQMGARELRYAYFDALHEKGIFSNLATGHHKDDSLETFIINLKRGSGSRGLSGIPEKRDYLFRPLLSQTRSEILEYMTLNQIDYCIDSSNTELTYSRNKIRHSLLPLLLKEDPMLKEGIEKSMKILQEENTLLNALILEKLEVAVSQSENVLSVDLQQLTTYPHCHIILYSILGTFGFSMHQCKEISAKSTQMNGAKFQSNSHVAVVNYPSLKLREETPLPASVQINGTGAHEVPGGTLHLTFTSEQEYSNRHEQELVQIPKEFYPLTWRTRMKGDRIQPLGMSQSKLLSDFFIDAKVSSIERDLIPLLCSGNDVLWVLNHRISDKIKCTDFADTIKVWFEPKPV